MKKVVFLLLVGLVLITSGCSVKKTADISNAERFAAEYSVSKDNPFVYASVDEVLEVLKSGTGIIFFVEFFRIFICHVYKSFNYCNICWLFLFFI